MLERRLLTYVMNLDWWIYDEILTLIQGDLRGKKQIVTNEQD